MAGAILLAEIFPGQADRADASFEGWAPPEHTHRWTVGAESRCSLPSFEPGPDIVLVLDLKPYIDADCASQVIMLAIDGRLLATIRLTDQRVMGFRLPAGPSATSRHTLSFTHLNSRLRRSPAGLDHDGAPLGVMVISLRLYRLRSRAGTPKTLRAVPGSVAEGDLLKTAEQVTGMPVPEFAGRFECLGHNCEIGTVQRALGAEPLGLLRFAGNVTHRLAEGLRDGFSQITAASTQIFVRNDPGPVFKVHEENYYLWYSTGRAPSETTAEAVHAEQWRKFSFLQRKFAEDLKLGEKIFAVSRSEHMTEAEALALFCALNLHARNTLLWTLPGDPSRAGEVEQLGPDFLLGHMGDLDPVTFYASNDAWLSVMLNAYRLKTEGNLLSRQGDARPSGNKKALRKKSFA
jgi:hypothetical protein